MGWWKGLERSCLNNKKERCYLKWDWMGVVWGGERVCNTESRLQSRMATRSTTNTKEKRENRDFLSIFFHLHTTVSPELLLTIQTWTHKLNSWTRYVKTANLWQKQVFTKLKHQDIKSLSADPTWKQSCSYHVTLRAAFYSVPPAAQPLLYLREMDRGWSVNMLRALICSFFFLGNGKPCMNFELVTIENVSYCLFVLCLALLASSLM